MRSKPPQDFRAFASLQHKHACAVLEDNCIHFKKSLYTSLVDFSYLHLLTDNRGVYSAKSKIDAIIRHICTRLANPTA